MWFEGLVVLYSTRYCSSMSVGEALQQYFTTHHYWVLSLLNITGTVIVLSLKFNQAPSRLLLLYKNWWYSVRRYCSIMVGTGSLCTSTVHTHARCLWSILSDTFCVLIWFWSNSIWFPISARRAQANFVVGAVGAIYHTHGYHKQAFTNKFSFLDNKHSSIPVDCRESALTQHC